MRIRHGVDDRLLVFIVSMAMVVGCVVQSGDKPAKQKPGAAGIEALSRAATIEALTASATAIDAVADRVRDGELKYDAALQTALGEAFQAGQDSTSNKRLTATMSAAMDPAKDTFDPVKVEKALREIAKGRKGLK